MNEFFKNQFLNGNITKTEFIDKMYEQHKLLFSYSQLLKFVDLASIQITHDGVLFTSKIDDVQIFCKNADKRTAPFEIMNFNSYESEDANLFFGLIKKGDVIFDIGANIGWYTIVVSKKYPNSIIHSFEPLSSTYKSLVKNVSLNNIQNVVLNNFGLSDSEKKIKFYSSTHTSVSNSAAIISEDKDVVIFDCEIKTMDSYVSSNCINVDVIKCDVEGAELFTFKGGQNTISKFRPIIFTEMLRKWAAKFNYHPNDMILFFKAFGYNCYVNNGYNHLKLITEVTDSTVQTNFFFLHPEKHRMLINEYEKQF